MNNKNNKSKVTIVEDGSISDRVPRFKVALLGEAGVGKTSLFLRIRDNDFKEGTPCSIGVDSCNFGIKVDNKEIKMALWDTAGVERFRTLTRNFYRNAHAVLLSFSVNNPSTLYHLSKWEEDTARYAQMYTSDITRNTGQTAITRCIRSLVESEVGLLLWFLVGCKNDLDMLVTKEVVESFAKTHGCEYAFITSSKTGQGIPEALAAISNRLMAVHCHDRADFEASIFDDTININQGVHLTQAQKKSCC